MIGENPFNRLLRPVLVEYHSPFPVDGRRFERGRGRPLVEDVEGHLNRCGCSGRDPELVDGRLTGRVGVEVRAHLHPEALNRLA